MKYFAKKTSPVINALIAVIEVANSPWQQVSDIGDADFVFVVDDRKELAEIYRPDKVFAFFSSRREENLPGNVFHIGLNDMIPAIARMIEFQKTFKPVLPQKKEYATPADTAKTKGSYRVLVIDDTPENLEFAQRLLEGHAVSLANGFAEGMRMLETKEFDVVLTDMEMPANRHYGALSYSGYSLDETYAYGMLVVFEATSRGIPVAVVTDANHHGNWMSAALDSLTKASVNGQRVLFFNNIGKRWDKALVAIESARG